jgi:Sel1 repeat
MTNDCSDMEFQNFDERYPGYSVREPDGSQHEILTAGRCYRVVRPFVDFDKHAHLPGEQWLFKGYSYWPRDDATTFFVSVDGGAHEVSIRFSEDPIDRDLEAYLAPVAGETNPAPAATTRERVLALVKTAFAGVRGAVPGDTPGTFEPEITPPLPGQWPSERFVYYAYARQILEADAENISEPWARIESGEEPVLVPQSGQLKWLGRQGVNTATVDQRMVFDSQARAAPLEDLLSAAATNADVAALVRKSYCNWQSRNLIARDVLARHPDFAGFLDCANVGKKPAARPQPDALFRPEFGRRFLLPKDRPDVWELRTTSGFPLEWPVGPKTKIAYYAVSIRPDARSRDPSPCEVTEPWGMVVRDGYDGALAFTSLTGDPKSLGVEPANAPTSSAHLRKVRCELSARHQTAIDELFLPAAQDPQLAALVGTWFKRWVEDSPLLAACVLPRHAAFAAFINAPPAENADAQFRIGWMYATGQGVAKDDKTAAAWYTKAAEQGNANAQVKLGWMYLTGHGVAKDEKAAVLWYSKAAERGNDYAQYNLGRMYAEGRGVSRDEKTAVLWYAKAAKQGYADAQFNLGAMYADGRGVTQDIVAAHLWFDMAARAGHAAAVKRRDLTAAQMPPMQGP